MARIFDAAPFEGGETYTHLLIQLDGDAAQELSSFLGGPDVPGDISVDDRIDLLVTLLHGRLQPSPQHAGLIVYAIPVMQTEAWILAGVVDDELAFESIDAKSEFRKRFTRYSRESRADVYERESARAAQNVDRILQRTVSFRRLHDKVH